jgi:uncharacterized protein YjdB
MRSHRSYTLLLTFATVLGLAACGDFFVSENSIDSVTVNPSGIVMKTSDTTTFTATAHTVGGGTSNSSVTWSTENSNIATVDSNGNATAVGAGSTQIRAKAGSVTGSGTALVTSGALPTTLDINGNASVPLNGTTQYTATITLNGTATDVTNLVTWKSSNTVYATVDSNGAVRGQTSCSSLTGTCPSISATLATTTQTLQSNQIQITQIQ